MNWPLIRQCFALNNVPSTYKGWQSQTIKFDNQWREANDIRVQSKCKDDRKPKKSSYIPRAQELTQDLGEPNDSCSDSSRSQNKQTQNICSMDTVPAPSSSSVNDKDAMIVVLMDKIDWMDKVMKD